MTIIDNELLIDLVTKAAANERLRVSFDLRNSEADSSQRMLNALMPGTNIPVHRHKTTTETVILIKGHVAEIFFDGSGNEVERIDLNPEDKKYGVQIPAGQWHTLIAYEPSVIIEVKDGAYVPIERSDILDTC